MKRVFALLLLSAAIPAVAQDAPHTFRYDPQLTPQQPRVFVYDFASPEPLGSSSSCEVSVVQASFDRPARLMPTAGQSLQSAPSLRLRLSNPGGKPILEVDLVAELKIKTSVYQLDSQTIDFDLKVNSTRGAQRVSLAKNALGFSDIRIRKVIYADGSHWSPSNEHACSYANPGSSEPIFDLK